VQLDAVGQRVRLQAWDSPAGENFVVWISRQMQAAQQARNLITDPGDQAGHVKFMIRDRGPDFTAAFDPVLADAGIRTVLCNVRTPRMNAIAERWTRGTRFSARTGPGAARADHLHDHVSATSATDRTASLRSAALPRLGQPAARGRTPRSPASMM
jgi:transposase InsO family protein